MIGADGRESREDREIERQDFVVTTSNKQLNFLQHIATILDINGRAAVVLPDNVLFFDKLPATEHPWTQRLWVYDLRTNQHFTLKQNQLRRKDLDDFVACYAPGKPRSERMESERFTSFTYDEVIARDKADLDITWLRDESLADLDNLPAPEVIARRSSRT